MGGCTYWPFVCLGGDLLFAVTLWGYSNRNLYGTATHFKSVPFTLLSLDDKHLLSYKCYFLGLQNSRPSQTFFLFAGIPFLSPFLVLPQI